MKNRKIILTVGCALALMLAPATVYADTAAQTSPRLGIPVVGSNGEAYALSLIHILLRGFRPGL